MKTITYDPVIEEEARFGWYLGARDQFVLRIIRKFTDLNPPKKILDAGCGTGGVISSLPDAGILKVGSDMSLESLTLGMKRGRIINGIQASVTNLPFRDETFDISISTEVLEHIDDDIAALKELRRVTKTRIIITVPGHKYLWTDSDDILLHKRRYSKSELSALAKKSGTYFVRLKPYGLIPGLLVIFYKFFKGKKSKTDKITSEDLPLSSRFKIASPIENMFKNLFLFDLWLSSIGLLLWGHSWWACIEKRK